MELTAIEHELTVRQVSCILYRFKMVSMGPKRGTEVSFNFDIRSEECYPIQI